MPTTDWTISSSFTECPYVHQR